MPSPQIKERLLKYGPWGLLLVVITVLVGIFFGREPEVRIEEKEKIVYVDKLVYIKQEDTEKKENEHKKENQVITEEKKTTVTPDGTTTVVETKKTENQAETVKTVVEIKKVTEYVDREKIVIQEKEVKSEPVKKDWRIGLKAGTSVTGLKLTPTAPYVDPIILQVDGERRIISLGKVDLYGGLWIQTSSFKTLDVGLGLSVVF